jgi:pimeloyl-ACP methyl ester carboxylesterase
MDTSFVDTHIGKIQLRRGGSGDPLVYLHSAQGEGEGLPLLDQLAGHFDLIAPVSPGFGESQGLEQIEDMEDVCFHLLDLFDRLELDAPVVAGLSLGGWMAAELAVRYPDRVGRLVLINPAGLYIEGAEIKDIFGRTLEEMVPDLYHDTQHPAAQMMVEFGRVATDPKMDLPFELIKPVFQSMSATAKLGWDPYLHDPKLRRRLWRIKAPTLVIRAEGDTLIPAAHAQAYAEEIPGATLVEIPQAAHMVVIERPDAVVEAITGWVGAPSR